MMLDGNQLELHCIKAYGGDVVATEVDVMSKTQVWAARRR